MWNDLSFRKKRDMIVDMVDGLDEADIEAVYSEWETRTYDDNLIGRDRALQDLLQIARDRLIDKLGLRDKENERVAATLRGLTQ